MGGVQSKNRWNRKLSVCCMLFAMLLSVMFCSRVAAATSVNISLAVRQIFENDDAPVLRDVTYLLIPVDSDFPLPGFAANPENSNAGNTVYSFVIQGDSEKELDPIIYDSPGTYTYTLTPDVENPEPGIVYDDQIYTVRVYVRNTVSGMVAEVGVLNNRNEKVGGIVYRHKYIPVPSDPSLMVDPPVSKTVAGNTSEDSTFTFKLEANDYSWPMPDGSTDGVKEMEIEGSGTKNFGTWSYTAAGNYTYTVSEVNTKEEDYEYDTTIYTITDVVEDVDGQLTLSRTVTNDSNKKVEGFDFINKYTGTDPTETPTPTGTSPAPEDGRDGDYYGGSRAGGILYSGRPKTGDDSQAGIYQILLSLGGVVFIGCMIFLVLVRRRKEEEDCKK